MKTTDPKAARKPAYRPVQFDPAAELAKDLRDPAFRAAWDALADEFATLDALLDARRRAGLTQAEVAGRMGMAQSALARVEASLASRKHSPSLTTLRRYAAAVGCTLEIRLSPRSTAKPGRARSRAA